MNTEWGKSSSRMGGSSAEMPALGARSLVIHYLLSSKGQKAAESDLAYFPDYKFEFEVPHSQWEPCFKRWGKDRLVFDNERTAHVAVGCGYFGDGLAVISPPRSLEADPDRGELQVVEDPRALGSGCFFRFHELQTVSSLVAFEEAQDLAAAERKKAEIEAAELAATEAMEQEAAARKKDEITEQIRKAGEAQEAARRKAEAAHIAKCSDARKAWIARHGSETLKRNLVEDFDFEDLYLEERLRVEKPGWRLFETSEGILKAEISEKPKSVNAEGFALLDGVRSGALPLACAVNMGNGTATCDVPPAPNAKLGRLTVQFKGVASSWFVCVDVWVIDDEPPRKVVFGAGNSIGYEKPADFE